MENSTKSCVKHTLTHALTHTHTHIYIYQINAIERSSQGKMLNALTT